jgi:hypothetical protein
MGVKRKQGDTLAPILFLFVIQAAMGRSSRSSASTASRCPRSARQMMMCSPARKTGKAGETFTFGKGATRLLAVVSPYSLVGARLLKQRLTCFGLVIRCGKMSPDGAVAN